MSQKITLLEEETTIELASFKAYLKQSFCLLIYASDTMDLFGKLHGLTLSLEMSLHHVALIREYLSSLSFLR